MKPPSNKSPGMARTSPFAHATHLHSGLYQDVRFCDRKLTGTWRHAPVEGAFRMCTAIHPACPPVYEPGIERPAAHELDRRIFLQRHPLGRFQLRGACRDGLLLVHWAAPYHEEEVALSLGNAVHLTHRNDAFRLAIEPCKSRAGRRRSTSDVECQPGIDGSDSRQRAAPAT